MDVSIEDLLAEMTQHSGLFFSEERAEGSGGCGIELNEGRRGDKGF